MPAAVGIRAGEILVSKYSHRLVFRERYVRASFLQINIVTTERAFKNDSIG